MAPKDLGRVDWMPRLKVWRVIEYVGKTDRAVGDYPSQEAATKALRHLVEGKRTPKAAQPPPTLDWRKQGELLDKMEATGLGKGARERAAGNPAYLRVSDYPTRAAYDAAYEKALATYVPRARAAAPAEAAGVAKEPWAMTREEFLSYGKQEMQRSKGPKIITYPDGTSTGVIGGGDLILKRPGRPALVMGKTELTAGSWDKQGLRPIEIDQFRRHFVVEALAEGKPVPANVLAEYPDLVESARHSPTKEVNMPKAAQPRSLSIPEQHQLKIARHTLEMPDAMVGVMGGPTKAQAREIIKRLTGRTPAAEKGSAPLGGLVWGAAAIVGGAALILWIRSRQSG